LPKFIFEKRIFYKKFPVLKKIASFNFFKSPEIATIANNLKRRLRFFFLLSHFEYSQIWLNILMDDRHLLNITKWKLI
jgi:hypothetical protein